MVILIDTREKKPFTFKKWQSHTNRASLITGDYSVKGFESQVCVERKAKIELYACLSQERERFFAEISRMNLYEYRAIVVENCSWKEFITEIETNMSREAVIGSMLSIMITWGIPVFFCSTRQVAEESTYQILLRAFRKLGEVGNG